MIRLFLKECLGASIDLCESNLWRFSYAALLILFSKSVHINEGHTLIIPKRHFKDFFEADENEIKAIYSLMHEVKEMLDVQYEPAGYNIGAIFFYCFIDIFLYIMAYYNDR